METREAATARNRYSGLRRYFHWLAEEEEIDRSPMAGMRPPEVEDKPIQVVTEAQMRALGVSAGHSVIETRTPGT